jgi:hypothetical protein
MGVTELFRDCRWKDFDRLFVVLDGARRCRMSESVFRRRDNFDTFTRRFNVILSIDSYLFRSRFLLIRWACWLHAALLYTFRRRGGNMRIVITGGNRAGNARETAGMRDK